MDGVRRRAGGEVDVNLRADLAVGAQGLWTVLLGCGLYGRLDGERRQRCFSVQVGLLMWKVLLMGAGRDCRFCEFESSDLPRRRNVLILELRRLVERVQSHFHLDVSVPQRVFLALLATAVVAVLRALDRIGTCLLLILRAQQGF